MNTRPLNSDPLRSFKFNVVIPVTTTSPDSPVGGEARLGFMSLSGLGISIEPLTYREGGDNTTTRKLPGQADFNPITLSRGLFSTDYDNWYWMSIIFAAMYGAGNQSPFAGTSAGTPSDFRTVMYINILEHPNTTTGVGGQIQGVTFPAQNGIVKVSFKLYSAWISSLAYSDLDAGGNAVGVEQMTLNYEGFDMKWGNNSYVPSSIVNTW